MARILIIDDEETTRDLLKLFLKEKGFETIVAKDGRSGIDKIKGERFDVILTDFIMPGIDGIGVLKEVSALKINTPVILITAFANVRSAVEAMKVGAFDYIAKPFNLDEILIVINRALNLSKLQVENVMLKKQLRRKYDFEGFVGKSSVMEQVYGLIEKIADTDSTVLITGESGTGKELIAKILHYNSSRSQGPFVPLNCAAIPRELLESELFGHEKGAFTGAVNIRKGRFELANNGTLFLDEVGELDPTLQVKLLRVLQEREFERVGGIKTIKVDVRILAATNKDLEKAVAEGKFREDLFYRLNVVPIHLPPLRKRVEDIPLLVEHFVSMFSKKRKGETIRFSRPVIECFQKYRWPGNVRELENLIQRLMILNSGSTIKITDLPEKFCHVIAKERESAACRYADLPGDYKLELPDSGIKLNETIEELERRLIQQALERTGGVKSKAAKLLGLNRTTLIEKLKKMN